MKKSRFSEEQIIAVLKEHQAGVVLSRQPHFRDLLVGHDRRDGTLRYARLRAPSANG